MGLLERRQPVDDVGPRVERVPGLDQRAAIALREIDTQLGQDYVEPDPVQDVEVDPRTAPAADGLQLRLVLLPPQVGGLLRQSEASGVADHAPAPVDRRAEHVEDQRPHLVHTDGSWRRCGCSRARTLGRCARHRSWGCGGSSSPTGPPACAARPGTSARRPRTFPPRRRSPRRGTWRGSSGSAACSPTSAAARASTCCSRRPSNLHRTPFGGRHFECFSEDPYLTGAVGAAFVRGLQAEGVAATVKHFVASDSETERFTLDAIVDERGAA